MKKRILLMAVGCWLLGVGLATAQDVTILHMKDGTQRRYTNGLKTKTQVQFYELALEKQEIGQSTTTHENGYSQTWDVTQAWHQDGQYAVAIVWEDDLPQNFQARHGLCFGSEPDLAVDHCDSLEYYVKQNGMDIYVSRGEVDLNRLHYFFIGKDFLSIFIMVDNDSKDYVLRLNGTDPRDNRIDAVLQPGKTYYYRTFAEVQVEENGQPKTTYFYGPEKSFRVPRVMADAGYFTYPQGSDDAVAAFAEHFPDSVTAPKWKEMEALWDEWRKTPEGDAIDISGSISTETFDDGTGYRLNHIPVEFYDWIASREVIIDAFDGLAEINKIADEKGDSIPVATPDSISNVDASWGVAGGKYIRFTPQRSTINIDVRYHSSEVMPGIRYKLQLNFAPETVYEKTDSTESYFLPTLIRVTDKKTSNIIINKGEVSGSETSKIEVDNFSTIAPGLDLKFGTYVSNSQMRNKLYNRIMRIAEIRLIPIRE